MVKERKDIESKYKWDLSVIYNDEAAFNANPMEFHVVCTDVETGKPVYRACNHANEDYMEWIRSVQKKSGY